MVYYYFLAARGNISKVQSQASVCIGCWGKAIRVLVCEVRSWKWIHGPPHFACTTVSKLLSVSWDCRAAAVPQSQWHGNQNLKLTLVIQETEEVWHPLKRIGNQAYCGLGCLYSLPSRDMLRKVKIQSLPPDCGHPNLGSLLRVSANRLPFRTKRVLCILQKQEKKRALVVMLKFYVSGLNMCSGNVTHAF